MGGKSRKFGILVKDKKKKYVFGRFELLNIIAYTVINVDFPRYNLLSLYQLNIAIYNMRNVKYRIRNIIMYTRRNLISCSANRVHIFSSRGSDL